MVKPAISVVCPTRWRLPQLRRLLTSIAHTAAAPASIQTVLRCDFDDSATVQFLLDQQAAATLQPRDKLVDLFIVGPRRNGYATLGGLFNEAVRLSSADLIFMANDDAEFVTPGWDTRLLAEAAKYPDGVFNLGVETANAGNFIFSCLSRRLVDALGFACDERLVWCDIWLRDIAASFGRAIRVPDVEVKHHWEGLTDDQRQASARAYTAEYDELYAACLREAVAKVSKLREMHR